MFHIKWHSIRLTPHMPVITWWGTLIHYIWRFVVVLNCFLICYQNSLFWIDNLS